MTQRETEALKMLGGATRGRFVIYDLAGDCMAAREDNFIAWAKAQSQTTVGEWQPRAAGWPLPIAAEVTR